MTDFSKFAFSAADDFDEAAVREAFSHAVPLRTVVIYCYDPRAADIPLRVAERLAAQAGDMSILALSAQVFAEVTLGEEVPAAFFTPPPKVDSQVVILRTRPHPLVSVEQEKAFFRVVKAGFSAKRKKLRSSLSGGLGISKEQVELVLTQTGIDPNARAEDLAITDWLKLSEVA